MRELSEFPGHWNDKFLGPSDISDLIYGINLHQLDIVRQGKHAKLKYENSICLQDNWHTDHTFHEAITPLSSLKCGISSHLH